MTLTRMTLARTPFVSRLAALGLLAVVAIMGWTTLGQAAIGWWRDGQKTRVDLAAQVDHLTLVAGRRAATEAALRRLNAALSDPAVFWSGPSAPTVSAAIQARLREIVTASGGSLRSTTDLPASPEHGLSRVILRLQTDGTVPALQAILSAIETSKPALFVDGIIINAADSSVAPANQPPMLSIQLDVTGYGRTS
jgi:hypothetical protein